MLFHGQRLKKRNIPRSLGKLGNNWVVSGKQNQGAYLMNSNKTNLNVMCVVGYFTTHIYQI